LEIDSKNTKNMANFFKKISISLFFLFGASSFAQQSDADQHKWRLGAYAAPSFHWFSSRNKDLIKHKGVNFSAPMGLQGEYKLVSFVYLFTGISYRYTGANLQYLANTHYVVDNNQIQAYPDKTPSSFYTLKTRNIGIHGIDVPMGVKLRTKDMGVWAIFGEIGLNHGFRVSSKSDDKVISNSNPNQQLILPGLDTKNDVFLYDLSGFVYFGAEFNLVAKWYLNFGLGYYAGFFNSMKKNDNYYLADQKEFLRPDMLSRSVALRIGIVFN